MKKETEESIQLFEVSSQWSTETIEKNVSPALQESKDEILKTFRSRVPEMSEDEAKIAAGKVSSQKITVKYHGAGSVPEMVEIAVKLTPLVAAIVPLVEPYAQKSAELAYKIGDDIWELIKNRLWFKYNIKLSPKKVKR